MKILNLSFFLAFISLAILITACKKEDTSTQNNNNPSTQTDNRDQYVGNYIVTDSTIYEMSGQTQNGPIETYILNISKGNTSKDTLFFNNLWNSNANYEAVLINDFFSFSLQQIENSAFGFTGNGNFNENQITYHTSSDEQLGFVHHYGSGEK